MLQPENVHPRAALNPYAGTEFPDGSRYTLRWMVPSSTPDILAIPNNADARFVTGTCIPKLSDLFASV